MEDYQIGNTLVDKKVNENLHRKSRMDAKLLSPLHAIFPNKSPQKISIQSPRYLPVRRQHLARPPTASSDSTPNDGEANDANSTSRPSIRYRSPRSKRQARKQREEEQYYRQPPPPAPKKWEEMTVAEKAVELYVGEKGLLFWLNKAAYASIYIIIGGWILFRFVGPALNLYQLDAPPLSPEAVLKGS